MATKHQILGKFGEDLVSKKLSCPDCQRPKTLKKLPPNFKCADVICDFCGMLAQVKSANVPDIEKIPDSIMGAAWKPQQQRLEEGIIFHLFLVLKAEKECSVYFIPKNIQKAAMFLPRKPLSENARRAGWQGFLYNLVDVKKKIRRVL